MHGDPMRLSRAFNGITKREQAEREREKGSSLVPLCYVEQILPSSAGLATAAAMAGRTAFPFSVRPMFVNVGRK